MVVLGIALSYKNRVESKVIYDSVLNKNQDGRVPHAPIFNSSNIYSGFQADYTERIYIYKYYGFGDLMSGIGGTNAFVNPILGSATVFFIINFLYTMAKMLIFKYKEAYHKENIAFL